jgi:alpha-tubulin suppressor-like RCC1 family protein
LGINDKTNRSSPVQIPGTTWSATKFRAGHLNSSAIKTDGTLWIWGNNEQGELGQNSNTNYSSPIQIPGTWSMVDLGYECSTGLKTDGTLWTWGQGTFGRTGVNIVTSISSPTQIPGTTWANVQSDAYGMCATKTDGTLWVWGSNNMGQLGQNSPVSSHVSSPVQIPGTTWSTTADSYGAAFYTFLAIKTDGTLWGWGRGSIGGLGQNNEVNYSSPIQIPGTTWSKVKGGYYGWTTATKTDGTLWMMGQNNEGQLGQNQPGSVDASSPVQVPGTTWSHVAAGFHAAAATKTDGTLWAWGNNEQGPLGQNSEVNYSSPVQIPGTDWHRVDGPLSNGGVFLATKQI